MITRDDCATFGFPAADRQCTITSDGLLRISEVCRILNIDRHTTYKLIQCDVLPAIRLNARVVRVPAAAVQRILGPTDR
jgi:excisionase family DNA binding protein